jgi:hypothetical protein
MSWRDLDPLEDEAKDAAGALLRQTHWQIASDMEEFAGGREECILTSVGDLLAWIIEYVTDRDQWFACADWLSANIPWQDFIPAAEGVDLFRRVRKSLAMSGEFLDEYDSEEDGKEELAQRRNIAEEFRRRFCQGEPRP